MSAPPSKSPQEMLEQAMASISKAFKNNEGATKTIQETLRSSINSGVTMTNSALANLEDSTEKIRKPMASSMAIVNKEGKQLAQEASNLYAVRHEYAPHLVGGASILGGLIGLRRGRVPAVVTASVAGFVSYLVVYQVDVAKLPDHIFGKE